MTTIPAAGTNPGQVTSTGRTPEKCRAVHTDCPDAAVIVAVFSTEPGCGLDRQPLCITHWDRTVAKIAACAGLVCSCGRVLLFKRWEPVR